MKRIVCAGSLFQAAVACYAEAFVTVFSGSLGTPNYFSGTNCKIWGEAVVTGPPTSGFVAGKLFVNDMLVWEFQLEEGIVMMQHMSMSARIDSTYFDSGSTLTVRMEAKDEDGNWYYSPPRNITTKNAILLVDHPDPDILDPAAMVGSIIDEPRFDQTYRYGVWTGTDFVNALAGKSTVFVATHGDPARFAAGFVWIEGPYEHWTYVYPSRPDRYDIVGHPEWLSGVGVDNYRPQQIGLPLYGPWLPSTLPPYNATANPPITLAFVLACETGQNSGFTSFCFPGTTAYGGPYLEDQAFMGSTEGVWLKDYERIAQKIYEELRVGKTLDQAREQLLYLDPPLSTYPDNKDWEKGFMAIHGDYTMRLETVYTGDHRPPAGWHLP